MSRWFSAPPSLFVMLVVVADGASLAAQPLWSAADVVDARIDSTAQRVLIGMLTAEGLDRLAAAGLVGAVKHETIRGIYQEDQQVPALMAEAMGIGWWQVIPEGRPLAVLASPVDGEAPAIVFRRQLVEDSRSLRSALAGLWLDLPALLGRAGASRGPVKVQGPFGPPIAVDLCLHWGTDCGLPAADYYCRLFGLAGAAAWWPAPDIGPTIVLGDLVLCPETWCDGFAHIVCRKSEETPTPPDPMAPPGACSEPCPWRLTDPKSFSSFASERYLDDEGIDAALVDDISCARQPSGTHPGRGITTSWLCDVTYEGPVRTQVYITDPPWNCGESCECVSVWQMGPILGRSRHYSCACPPSGGVEFQLAPDCRVPFVP